MSTEFTRIRYESDAAGVATVTFSRPERRNALDHKSVSELSAALEIAAASSSVRCLVITGEGSAFCSGADVKDWASRMGEEAESEEQDFGRVNDNVVSSLYHFPKPLVASVNGPAVGMGMGIALAADFRIGSTNARFSCFYIRIGTVPDFGDTYLLPRLVGLAKATDLVLTGRMVEATEAGEIGLLTEVVAAEELADATRRWTEVLASGPTVALGVAKRNLRYSLSADFDSARMAEILGHRICAETEDHKEGVKASAERREPRFIGR
jgi:2-(1,2-epoxy-1,2-dihydrophenyl)acetyl-CoA isomerase